jgi:hypothetical protein
MDHFRIQIQERSRNYKSQLFMRFKLWPYQLQYESLTPLTALP